jgi:Tol biopolymer transport system component
MHASGGAAIQLTDYESVAPSVSPDGKLLACISPPENRVQFARLDVINFETGEAVKSFEVLPFEWNFRVSRWTAAGDALIFQKNDKPAGNLWKQSLAGGEPKQYTDFTSQRMHNYAFSRDGKRLLIARGDVKLNVVMLKNFKPN